MERDNRKPSEVVDDYWILAINEKKNYKIPRGNSGKWLVFEHKSEIDQLWRKIREATINGALGGSSKTSTAKPNRNAANNDFKVIFIYTADFSNTADVERIEKNIRELGIDNKLIYKLDKDVGKYQNQGHKNLSQKISYSQKYYQTLKWLNENKANKYIRFQGLNQKGKQRFRFQRLDIEKEAFELKKLIFTRLGFYIEQQKEISGEAFFSRNKNSCYK